MNLQEKRKLEIALLFKVIFSQSSRNADELYTLLKLELILTGGPFAILYILILIKYFPLPSQLYSIEIDVYFYAILSWNSFNDIIE